MNNESIITGKIIIVKHNEVEPIIQNVKWDLDNKQKIIEELVTIITGKKDGKISNLAYLPSPIEGSTGFINFDQTDPELPYSMNLFGNPIYGNMVLLSVDMKSENGDIRPYTKVKDINQVKDFIINYKQFERKTGIYEAMLKTDKMKFIEEFVKEQNNVLRETTKVTTDTDKEVEEAHKMAENEGIDLNNIDEENLGIHIPTQEELDTVRDIGKELRKAQREKELKDREKIKKSK